MVMVRCIRMVRCIHADIAVHGHGDVVVHGDGTFHRVDGTHDDAVLHGDGAVQGAVHEDGAAHGDGVFIVRVTATVRSMMLRSGMKWYPVPAAEIFRRQLLQSVSPVLVFLLGWCGLLLQSSLR